ncbi:hypothetical protein BDQ17DRAFT_1363666 [Cyathus striatus]|nr:hypothetical protein BDQ17DRAFT_1363666 [Cyathus striatus]
MPLRLTPSSPARSPNTPPVEIAISVSTEVVSDFDMPQPQPQPLPSAANEDSSHGSTSPGPSPSPRSAAHSTPATTTRLRMSLPPDVGKHRRTIGVYLAGALFALANWTFLDAAILSAHARSPWGPDNEPVPPPVHVTFVDWVPGICSLLGYLVINMIDKDRIRGDEGFGDARAVWRARLILFIGFALMAGGLAGSVTVLVLKYILHNYPEQFTYYGYANVSQSVAMMLSAIVLWIAQNTTSSEYEYNLTL